MEKEVRPVFMRWQIYCLRCDFCFYINTEPTAAIEEVLKLPEIEYEYYPSEGSVVEFA